MVNRCELRISQFIAVNGKFRGFVHHEKYLSKAGTDVILRLTTVQFHADYDFHLNRPNHI